MKGTHGNIAQTTNLWIRNVTNGTYAMLFEWQQTRIISNIVRYTDQKISTVSNRETYCVNFINKNLAKFTMAEQGCTVGNSEGIYMCYSYMEINVKDFLLL